MEELNKGFTNALNEADKEELEKATTDKGDTIVKDEEKKVVEKSAEEKVTEEVKDEAVEKSDAECKDEDCKDKDMKKKADKKEVKKSEEPKAEDAKEDMIAKAFEMVAQSNANIQSALETLAKSIESLKPAEKVEEKPVEKSVAPEEVAKATTVEVSASVKPEDLEELKKSIMAELEDKLAGGKEVPKTDEGTVSKSVDSIAEMIEATEGEVVEKSLETETDEEEPVEKSVYDRREDFQELIRKNIGTMGIQEQDDVRALDWKLSRHQLSEVEKSMVEGLFAKYEG